MGGQATVRAVRASTERGARHDSNLARAACSECHESPATQNDTLHVTSSSDRDRTTSYDPAHAPFTMAKHNADMSEFCPDHLPDPVPSILPTGPLGGQNIATSGTSGPAEKRTADRPMQCLTGMCLVSRFRPCEHGRGTVCRHGGGVEHVLVDLRFPRICLRMPRTACFLLAHP